MTEGWFDSLVGPHLAREERREFWAFAERFVLR